jgi:hypothetical protein
MTCAVQVKDFEDPYVADAEKAMWILSVTTVPGAWVVDSLPIRKFSSSTDDLRLLNVQCA